MLDTQNRPTLESLAAKGIPYYVVVNDQQTFDTFDGDIDTSKKFKCTLFYYDQTTLAQLQGYQCAMAQTRNDIGKAPYQE